MNFSLYIAQRYLKSKSGNNIINIVTILACMGVLAGTVALFVVLSVFSGIKNYSVNILELNTPDLRMIPKEGKNFEFTDHISDQLKNTPHNFLYSKVIEEKAFFKHDEKEEIAYLKGVDENFSIINPIDSLVFIGNWIKNPNVDVCVVDYHIAQSLEVNIFTDLLQVFVPKLGKGYINDPRKGFSQIKPQVIGICSSSGQNTKNYIYTPIKTASRLLKLDNKISYIDVDVQDNSKIDKVYLFLSSSFEKLKVLKKQELNSSFYKILNSEKLIAYLVSVLVIIMVLSNTSGTIIMVIVDKKENIKTLLNIGASLRSIQKIFTFYGVLLNLLGMLLGLFLGIIIIYAQIEYELLMITPTVPYPVQFEWQNVWWTSITIFVLGTLTSLLASTRISRTFGKE